MKISLEKKPKLIRITTIPESLAKLLEGQLNFLNNYFEVIAVSSNNVKLKEVGIQEKVSTFSIEMTRQITPLKDMISLWKMYRFLKKEKPLIVHTHTPKAGTIGMIASFIARVPYRFHTVAGLPLVESKGLRKIMLEFVEMITYKCANIVLPNSNGLCEIILKRKLTVKNKLYVIGNGSSNGIDTNYFDYKLYGQEFKKTLKKSLSIESNDFVYLFVGRLVGDKGINELVLAFEKVEILNKNTKLLLVGDYEKSLDPLNSITLNKIKNNKNIISIGYKNDVRPYFAISDLFVFPSYREGFPNVLLQANSMGVPALSSDINGCNEIIINNKNGLLIPPKNPLILYEQMLNFLNNKINLAFSKEEIRQRIIENFSQKFVQKSLLDFYKSKVFNK